jgi:hypothetical protein
MVSSTLSSIRSWDLLEIDRVTEEWAGEIYFLEYNPAHEWRWLSKQTHSETCAFVIFDSRTDSKLNGKSHFLFYSVLEEIDGHSA